MEKIIKGSKIVVDCIPNDPVDIRAGGAKILGYDYFVRQEEAPALIKLVSQTLEELKLPVMDIRVEDEGKLRLAEKEVWTKERIVQNLIDDSDTVRSEYERRLRNGTYRQKV